MVALRYPQRPRLRAAFINRSISAWVRYSRGRILAFFCRFGGACRLTTVPISVFRAGSLMSGSIAGNHQYLSRTVPLLAFFGTVPIAATRSRFRGAAPPYDGKQLRLRPGFEEGSQSDTGKNFSWP